MIRLTYTEDEVVCLFTPLKLSSNSIFSVSFNKNVVLILSVNDFSTFSLMIILHFIETYNISDVKISLNKVNVKIKK